ARVVCRPPPAGGATPGAPGSVPLFWRADNGELMHRAQVRGQWLEPESLGGTLASNPAAIAWGVDQLEVFAVFPDGDLWDRFWDGRSWHEWESLGGELSGDPAASSSG